MTSGGAWIVLVAAAALPVAAWGQIPQVTLQVSPNPLTEGETATVTASVPFKAARDVVLQIRANPETAQASDFTLSGNRLAITGNSLTSTGTVTITATADSEADDGETVRVVATVSGGGGHPPAPAVLIINDASSGGGGGGGGGGVLPQVTLSVSPNPLTEGRTATVTASLSSPAASAATITVAAAPATAQASDFTLSANRTLEIASGRTASTGTVTIAATEDEASESDETVTVSATVSGGASAPENVTLTIRNADSGGGGGGGGGPPKAAITVDAECANDLCRARTGAPVAFQDASTGTILRRQWDFGDGMTSRSATRSHAWTSPGFYEVTLRVVGGAAGDMESTASLVFLVEAAEPAGTCTASDNVRCLQNSRFQVAVDVWTAAGGEVTPATVVPAGSNDSGLFWFFQPNNWEMLVKVLDGCPLNGNFWVLAAATTDVGYRIRVTDTKTGAVGVKEYRNEPGTAAGALLDIEAFPDSCSP